ncbi:type II secretion system protein J (GspJ) [Oryzisolibacter propanilivorax]|uniref:Type II secretion system protein J (GspJ) n=1 Tax=Oryzisolibacter propanilivorax TaxID=1527607 RepID=A0A1G9S5J6_9BURK|nr:type II secretion system protein [Oryzisolibacter propanilivorax]SDM30671.1 type II secretion system protein J (GspJ) [Oryzisolibacter propanilivorax]
MAGFTLLELIIALAIASLVALIGASALSGMLDFRQRSAQRADARADVRAAERVLRHEWAARGKAVRSDGRSLEFDTLHPIGTGGGAAQPALAHVRLACEIAPSGALELLHFIRFLPLDGAAPSTQGPPRWQDRQVLATGLRSCAFSFLARLRGADGQEHTRWQTRWEENQPAPQLMRLALSGLREDMPPVVYTARSKPEQPR